LLVTKSEPQFKSLSKSIVVTPYSNNNMKKVVEECGWEFILSAPGVKNLHREAIKSDISIYFEKNGHGNIHFSEDALKLKNLYEIDKLLYSKAGDSIALFILTIFALNYLKMTTTDFTNLLENTIQVNDKIIRTNLNVKLLTNEIETEITDTLYEYLSEIFYEYGLGSVIPHHPYKNRWKVENYYPDYYY